MTQTALDLTSPPFAPSGDLSAEERRVWVVLKHRRGAESAIRVPDLAELADLSTRKVQRIVHDLIHREGIPVGTSMRRPYGNFLAVTPEERRKVAELHKRRAIAELATAAAIEGVDRAEYVRRHQTELEVEPA